MSEPTGVELGRLAEELGDRVVPPPFEEVVGRARRRRRSQLVTVVAAVVMVGAGTGVVLSPDEPGLRPQPAGPPSADALPADVADLVEDPRAHPFEIAGGLDGSLAVVWRDLVQPEPTFALVVRDAAGTARGQLLDAPFDLTAVPGGWVGIRDGLRAFFVTVDGTLTDLPVDPATVTPEAGDVIVPTASRPLLWRPSTERLLHPELPSGSTAAVVTADGVLVSASPGALMSMVDGEPVTSVDVPVRTVVLAGQGDDVTAVALGDGPDGSLPVEWVVSSHDSGRTWQSRQGTVLEGLESMAVTGDDTTLIGSPDGVYVLEEDGDLVRSRQAESLRSLTSAGDRIYALSVNDERGPLWWSDDAGASWHRATVPGL